MSVYVAYESICRTNAFLGLGGIIPTSLCHLHRNGKIVRVTALVINVDAEAYVSKWRSGQSSLRWRHNERDGVSNHQPHHCLLDRLFGCRSKKTSKLRVTGLCAGNSPGTGEFPAQMASNAENVSIWWRHHDPGDLSMFKFLCSPNI